MKKIRSLFEYEDKMQKISAIGDPLERLNKVIPWEKIFSPVINKIMTKEPKGSGGRPRYDYIFMLKVLVIQRTYNLSDEQTEYQINDRLSFQRFLGIDLSSDVPDYTTIWKFREALVQSNAINDLFKSLQKFIENQGYKMKSGSIIDASFVEAPRQRNTKDENDQIKKGEMPSGWSEKKQAHKDIDAQWTTKNHEKHYGYKNHAKVDIKTKFITNYKTTSANVHDSQMLGELLQRRDRRKKLYGDSAYRSAEIEQLLKEKKIKSMIHEKGYRNNPLTDKQKKRNKTKSKIRVRVEHVFGFIENTMKGSFVRCIGINRADGVIGLMNITYNMNRYMQLEA